MFSAKCANCVGQIGLPHHMQILVLAWIAKFDPYNRRINEGRNWNVSAENGVPRCIDADNSLFA